MSALVLYGPPTAGKDTITSLLAAADSRFRLVTKLKQGSGRTAGYRFVTLEELDGLRAEGRIVVETQRYGNTYAVDRRDLDDMQSQGLLPVVHIGNVDDLRRLQAEAPGDWARVLLWVSRQVCADRSGLRGDTDTADRLKAWDETASDLLGADPEDLFDLVLRTDEMSADEAALAITDVVSFPRPAPGPDELRAVLNRLAGSTA